MINRNRIKERFISLAVIGSESRKEARLARKLKKDLERMGAAIFEDAAAQQVGSNCGNLIARFGKRAPFLMLNAHLDTVRPGEGVKPIVDGDIIRSDGTTILGADCKSGLTAILEALESLTEDGIKPSGIEVVFTISEEIGLLGAKHLDYKSIKSKCGFALDTSNPDVVVTSAPAANRITIDIFGVESHAGVAPEKGISAALIAAEALKSMKLGRIDFETTANIGIIEGGTASNIIPGYMKLTGEARSHNMLKLARQTKDMLKAVETAAKNASKKIDGKLVKPKFIAEVKADYPAMRVKENSSIMRLLDGASKRISANICAVAGSGGSDANIFNSRGIETVIIGTGMTDVHSRRESVKISQMEKSARLIRACIEEWMTRGSVSKKMV